MNLVIIEGVGKVDTIKKYLGTGYEVFATKGHVRDLPEKTFGVDIKNNFEPEYTIMLDKKSIITDLKAKAQKAEQIYLATDPDREGEAISWHLAHILNFKPEDKCRIEFNEISKQAIQKAMLEPRIINQNLVNAQQARRVLDRIVGYKLSPVISKKIKPRLSAGRVQSVALKILVERELEIAGFKPEEYWNINALLSKEGQTGTFKAQLVTGKNTKIENKEQADKITSEVKNATFTVTKVKKSVTKMHAPAPYITSTLQQDALNKIGLSLKKTSQSAQNLYEGVDLPEGKTALVTYIRTDSTRISEDAIKMAREYISNKYGNNYLPEKPNFYASKQSAQDAHEAIRPISLAHTPESVKQYLSIENYKLYKLIYDRFIACQMSEATYNSVAVDINANKYDFKVTGRTLVFTGFTAAYSYIEETKDGEEKDENKKLPVLNEDEILRLNEIISEQKFTKAPPRYSEAGLIKVMEEKGIGRPATYTPTILVLDSRGYTEKQGKILIPTELGMTVSDWLTKHFNNIINVTFTAKMEDELDKIEEGNIEWQNLIGRFYNNFAENLKKADLDREKVKMAVEESDVICEKCGARMVIREGQYGKFLACPNFPTCKNTKPFNKPCAVCPQCGKDVYKRTSKAGKTFYACSGYPECKYISWDRPITEKCPDCGSYLVEKHSKDGALFVACSNGDCKYTKHIEYKKPEKETE
ncbi:MAG: type I DNA topoisomerase [Clostridia bacterium]